MIQNHNLRARAKLSGGVAPLVLAFAMIGAPATAQTATPSDLTNQENATSQLPTGDANASTTNTDTAIVVTGSRIKRRDLVTAAPITVVSDEEFKLSGSVNVESVINALPQVVPGTTAFSNNPGGGVATLNLRNLGSQRTLVLVNGRRYMFYDTSQRVDLNTIPQFLIDGVDVVTGGASAVYGSDAISGVVNFRLRNDLVGVEAGGQYQITERGDGRRYNAHLAIGTGFDDDKGHVTLYSDYYKRAPIYQNARSGSAIPYGDSANGLIYNGNATVPQGRIVAASTQVVAAGNGLAAVTLNRGAGTNYGSPLGAIFNTPGTSSIYRNNTQDGYNIASANLLMVPQERYLFGGYGEYKVNDNVTAYTEVSFANNRVENQLAATPVTGTFNVNIANNAKYLSAADVAQLNTIDTNEAAINAANVARGRAAGLPGAGVVALSVNRRLLETGGRLSQDERNSFRMLTGVKGDITPSLHYDAYYSYARTRNANVQLGNISRSGFTNALLAGDLNIFGAGTITPAQLASVSILAQNNDISVLQVASASLSGELFDFGLGGDKVAFAFGGEWRGVNSQFIPDTALSSGDVIGFNAGDPTEGRYGVHEVFGELNVPIIGNKPFFHRLEVHGAGRYSDYSLDAVGGVYTYAGDATWAPIPDLTFRGQYSRAIRAPNVGELFGGQSQGFPAATDPCGTAAAVANAATTALCQATGVPAGLVGTAGLSAYTQIQGLFGGNPNLREERSTSYTFGAVVSPRFIPRLNIKADYFNIKVDNAIATAGGGVANILSLCYNTIRDANSAICQLIQRNPSSGQIDGSTNADGTQNVVTATNANIASLKTSGIDLGVDYTQPLNFGLMSNSSRLLFGFNGTWTEKDDSQPIAGLDTVACAGKYGALCGNPHARYKWTTRLSFVDGPMTISGRWRHVGAVRDDDDTTDYTVERIKAYNQYDLSFSLDVTDKFSLSAGVNNLLDKLPPVLSQANSEQANTFPGTYDVLGRDFFVSTNFRF